MAELFAGPQNQYPGLDQVNAELPASLAGAGEVTVSFAVSGKPTNPVTIAFNELYKTPGTRYLPLNGSEGSRRQGEPESGAFAETACHSN